MFGGEGFTIQPRKGELIVFDKLARPLLSSIILPVPTARTKGVLVAPTVFGNVLVGPTAQDVTDRSEVSTSAAGLAALVAAGRQILPPLEHEEVTATYAGLRAATEHRDYQVSLHGRYVRVAGIRSTGLTASLGIAEHVAGLLREAGLQLLPRADAGGGSRRECPIWVRPDRAPTRMRIRSRPTPRTGRSPATASGSRKARSGTRSPVTSPRPDSTACGAGPGR